jgi:hypothetical protein
MMAVPNVIESSAIILIVMAPTAFLVLFFYHGSAECHCVKCHYTNCRGTNSIFCLIFYHGGANRDVFLQEIVPALNFCWHNDYQHNDIRHNVTCIATLGRAFVLYWVQTFLPK